MNRDKVRSQGGLCEPTEKEERSTRPRVWKISTSVRRFFTSIVGYGWQSRPSGFAETAPQHVLHSGELGHRIRSGSTASLHFGALLATGGPISSDPRTI
jgi:hypothetical protein